MGNHMTSWGLTRATVKNHGSVPAPGRGRALARSHWAALEAMIGIEVDAGPGPPHEVPVVAVPVREAVGLHVGVLGLRQVPFPDVRGPVAAP